MFLMIDFSGLLINLIVFGVCKLLVLMWIFIMGMLICGFFLWGIVMMVIRLIMSVLIRNSGVIGEMMVVCVN